MSARDTSTGTSEHNRDCYSCGEEMPRGECAKSKAPCGHHCNHSWTHDACCWCGAEFLEYEQQQSVAA